jgi:uncharacterized membrane protein YfcA
MLQGFDWLWIALAAGAAGAINALAGGGTLITFPVLLAIGVPAVSANVTNTVALLPGYIGGTVALRHDLRGQRRRLLRLLPASVIGGVLGGVLLLASGEKLFRDLVPWLILGASLLLAVQTPLRRWLQQRRAGEQAAVFAENGTPEHGASERGAIVPMGLAAIYGGYFGAGLGVITLAVLGLVVNDSLTRLNAIKQLISFAINLAAAVFFLFSGHVIWPIVFVMAGAALLGGNIGGRFAGSIKPDTLRLVVVIIGIAIGLIYLFR